MRRIRLGYWDQRLLISLLALFVFGASPNVAKTQGLGVVPVSLDFGSTAEQVPKRKSITIQNSASDSASVSWIRLDGNGADRFLIDRRPFVLAPSESRTLLVQFLPEDSDTFSATLILGNSNQEVAVPLTGLGSDPYAYLTTSHWTVISDARLGAQGAVANLSPGASTSLLFNYHSWSRTGCPSCIIYIAAGVEADGQGAYGVGIPGRYPGQTGPGSVNLHAPNSPGVYTVYGLHAPEVNSSNAIALYESSFPGTANSTFMPLATIAVITAGAPAVPVGLDAQVSTCNNVVLSWDKALTSGLSSYHIYRGILPFALTLIDSVDAKSTSFVDFDVRPEVHYFYRIRAVDSLGRESGFSNAVNPATGPRVVGIDCHPEPLNAVVAALGEEVCFDLRICGVDSVYCSTGSWQSDTFCFIADSLGSYQFAVVAIDTTNGVSDSCSFTVNVSGVIVEHESVQPGGTVAVPIKLSTSQPLSGYTIPLRYSTMQPNKVHLDSVSIDPDFPDSASVITVPDSSWFIVTRPMQPVPLPPDTGNGYTVAWAYFSIDADAQAEVIPIDTTTISYGLQTYSYQFVDTLGTAFVPLFVPGSVTVTAPPTDCLCGDVNCDEEVNIADAAYMVNRIFSGGPAPMDVSHGDVNCDGGFDISDALYMVYYIFANGPAPCAGPLCSPSSGLEKLEAVMGDIWLETEHVGDSTVVTVVCSSPVDIGALQLDLTGVAADESGITRLAGDMALFSSKEGDRQKIGLIDMTGHKPLGSGEQKVLRLGMGSRQNVQISSAILVGTDARHLAVTVQVNRSSVTVPDRYDLAQNCPNPFNPTTFISYSLPAAGQVKLEVLNVLGQHVATLVDDYRAAGVHRAIWEGTDDQGRSVASGVYFYRLRADNFTQTRRMVLLK